MKTEVFAAAFDQFADTVEGSLTSLRDEIRAVRAENERMSRELEQVRAAAAQTRSAEPDMLRSAIAEQLRTLELPRGEPGPPGPEGPTGPQGPQGEKGATGERGTDGTQGPQGERGERGADGTVGERGADGAAGPQGERGETGMRGESGPAGRDGEDGISSEAEIARAVDEHTRAAFASHMRTWHRGLYRANEQYLTGQGVTYNGGTWMANRDTTTQPGMDDSWSCIVKPGRDGRDRTK